MRKQILPRQFLPSALRLLDGVADDVHHRLHGKAGGVREAAHLVDGDALQGAEVLWVPVINQGLVRFHDPAGVHHDGWTDRVIARIVATGEAFVGGTTWRGKRAMRVSVCHWRTTAGDVERTIAAVSRVLGTHE